MADDTHTLGFGVTYDMVATRTACGQLLTLTSHRCDDRIPPHRHTNNYLCIVLNGGFSEQEGNRWHERLSGGFFIHRAGEIHHDRFGPRGAVCVNLHFPEGEPGPAVEGRCSPATRVAAQRLAFELAASSREDLAMASFAAEIMGAVEGKHPMVDHGLWLRDIVEAISDEPERRWTLGELARIADRHPVHVAQTFRARTGISLGLFQRLRRLTSISLALRSGVTTLAELAAEFGYCDQSHMSTEFRAAFGISPGRYRREFH